MYISCIYQISGGQTELIYAVYVTINKKGGHSELLMQLTDGTSTHTYHTSTYLIILHEIATIFKYQNRSRYKCMQ